MRYDDVQGDWGFEDSQNPWSTIGAFNSDLLGENYYYFLYLMMIRFEERILYKCIIFELF